MFGVTHADVTSVKPNASGRVNEVLEEPERIEPNDADSRKQR